jgi:hypothetical protein
MRPPLILPSQLFADRYARPLPIAKALKRDTYHQILDGARSPNGEISTDEQVAIKNSPATDELTFCGALA